MNMQHKQGQADGAGYRVAHDSMGEVRVPLIAKWQAQTQRAVDNFPVSGRSIDRALVRALAVAEGRDLRAVVLELELLTEEEVGPALDVEAMTRGGIIR